jgi:O-antigen ligase
MAVKIKTERNRISPDPWYDRSIRFCLYALVAAMPAVFCTYFHTAFALPKLAILRFLTAAIIALWGCKVFVEGKFYWRISKLNIFLLVYGLVSIVTTILSIAPLTSFYGTQGRFVGIVTMLNLLLLPFFVYNFLKDAKVIAKFTKISLIVAAIMALYGLAQYFGITAYLFRWNADTSERVFGTIGHGNHFGAYLGMNILLGIFLLPYIRTARAKLLPVTGLMLMCVTLVLTASRGALFATIFAAAVCGLIAAIKNWGSVKSFLKRLPVIIALCILGLLLAGSMITGQFRQIPLVERTAGTIEFIRQGNVPDRLSWILSSLEMIKDRPIFGFGLSTYRDIYNAYRRTDYIVPGPGDMQDLITPEAAHNEYLNIAATQGLAGLAAFLVIVIFVFYRLDRITSFAKKTGSSFYLALGIKGALMVYLVQVFVSFGEITTLTIFYLFLGLGAVVAATEQESQVAHLKIFRLKAAAKYLLSFGMILVCCLIGYMTFKEAAAEYFYKQAIVRGASGDLRGAIENFQRTVLAKPGDYAYYAAFGDFALKNADRPALNTDTQLKMLLLADANYQNAVAVNPHHPSVFYNMAVGELQLYKMTGQKSYFDAGAQNLERAVILAVNNPLYPYQAAKALLGTGLEGIGLKAEQYFKQALLIRPGYSDAETWLKQLTSSTPAPRTAP